MLRGSYWSLENANCIPVYPCFLPIYNRGVKMNYKDFAYFLSVENVKPQDREKLLGIMKQENIFSGALSPCYDAEAVKQNRISFDCDACHGSISEIALDNVEEAMHELATTFPNARFHLFAENVDDHSEQYQMCTFGNMYQYAERQSYMPELSPPVPFEARTATQMPFGEKDFLNEFLHNTDFDFLFQQKMELLESSRFNSPLPREISEGLVNFLDFLQDWAESQGVYRNPEAEHERMVDELVNVAKKELNRDGQFFHTLADEQYAIYIFEEANKKPYPTRMKSFYECQFFHVIEGHPKLLFSAGIDSNNPFTLREFCDSCVRESEKNVQQAKRPSLDTLISSANTDPSRICDPDKKPCHHRDFEK